MVAAKSIWIRVFQRAYLDFRSLRMSKFAGLGWLGWAAPLPNPRTWGHWAKASEANERIRVD